MGSEKILVTGGTGFVGTKIVEALIEQHPEYEVVVLDIATPQGWEPYRADIEYVQADITQLAEVVQVVCEVKPTVVVHTAGCVPHGQARYKPLVRDRLFRINVEGTRNMLKAAQEAGATAFVHTSSCCVIADDHDHDHPNMDETVPLGHAILCYGQSKAEAEALVLAENTPTFSTCALRPSVIFGPGDNNFLPSVHGCIAQRETNFLVGNGVNLFDFTYVTNVADAHILAIENLLSETKTAAGEAFFISNCEPVPFWDVLRAIWAHFGHYPSFQVRVPTRFAWTAGYLAEWYNWFLGQEGGLSRGSVKDSSMTAYANCSKARNILGYKPRVGLVEGLRISCESYQQELRAKRKNEELLSAYSEHDGY